MRIFAVRRDNDLGASPRLLPPIRRNSRNVIDWRECHPEFAMRTAERKNVSPDRQKHSDAHRERANPKFELCKRFIAPGSLHPRHETENDRGQKSENNNVADEAPR